MDLDKLLMLNYVHVVHIVPSKEGGHKMNIRFKAPPPSPSQPAQPRQGPRFKTRMIIGIFCSDNLCVN